MSEVKYKLDTDGVTIYCDGKRIALALETDVGRSAAIHNAYYIAKCVNLHNELVEVLKLAKDVISSEFFMAHYKIDETLKKAGVL